MGNAWGMENLGELYENDAKYDDAKYVKARYWYEKAANKGIAWGRYHLARLYEYGFGGAKNDEMAIYWYKRAAEDEAVKEKAEEALRLLHAL